MLLTCRELSVWLWEPGAALELELHVYEPTDTITLEHVVLIASRADAEASGSTSARRSLAALQQ